MRIRYKKNQLNLNLYLGLTMLVPAILQTIFATNLGWSGYSWYLVAAINLIAYLYQKQGYLIINNGMIIQNRPFGKKMNLQAVKQIKHFDGAYTLISDSQKLKINIGLIDEDAQSDLRTELNKLKVEWV